MPVPWPRQTSTSSTTDVALSTTTETAVLTLSGVSLDGPSQSVLVFGYAAVTTGAGTTSLTFRVRRGTGVTGTVVGEPATVKAGASESVSGAISVIDSPGEVAGQAYTLTVQQVAATANGTVTEAAVQAVIL